MNQDTSEMAVTDSPLVSVIIPVFNESATILEVLGRLSDVDCIKEIILVDDGSTDDLQELLATTDWKVIIAVHPRNLGKGAAIRSGLQRAGGEIVVIQDADMEYDPRQISAILEPIATGQADVCYGTRFASASRSPVPLGSRWANKFLTWLSNRFTGLQLTDMETCHKAFRRSAVDGMILRESRFGIEPELTAKFAKRKLRFAEVPITYSARTYDAGKKIAFKDGLRAVWCIFRYAWRD